MAALNSRADAHGTLGGNISTNMSMNTRNHLTLFQDEYPETPSDGTLHSTSISIVRNVDVRREPVHEMAIMSVSSNLLLQLLIHSTDWVYYFSRKVQECIRRG